MQGLVGPLGYRNLGDFLERSALDPINPGILVTGNFGGFEERSAVKDLEKSAKNPSLLNADFACYH